MTDYQAPFLTLSEANSAEHYAGVATDTDSRLTAADLKYAARTRAPLACNTGATITESFIGSDDELRACEAELGVLLREHFVPGTTQARRFGSSCEGCTRAEQVCRRIVALRQQRQLTEAELFAAHGVVGGVL